MTTHPTRRALLTGAVSLAALAACDSGSKPSGSSSSNTPTSNSPKLVWGPTEEQYENAKKLVADWSPELLAGQVLVLTFVGTTPDEAGAAIKAVQAGGAILMGDNIVDAEQVATVTKAIDKAVRAEGRDFPAVIAVDQEGGLVSRMGDTIPRTPSFMSAGAAIAGEPQTRTVADASMATGNALRALGFTWVFAPDADVTIGPKDPTIGSRSAGDDPELVAKAVTTAVDGFNEAQIINSVKHFPGHGSVTSDSHLGLPTQSASLATLREHDLPPFTAAAKAGCPVIMMSHIAVDAFEPGVPCTVSPAAYANLRRETGFEGVICTDAMNMGAITDKYGPGPAAAKAIIAGADVVLMPADAKAAQTAILAALKDGSLAKTRLQEAAARVVALQLMNGQAAPAMPPKAANANLRGASERLSAAAVTFVSGQCASSSKPLVTDAVQVQGGNDADRQAFTAAAKAVGIPIGSGPTIFLARTDDAGSADIVVSLETPYVLRKCRATTARYALYGRTEAAFTALLNTLTGKEPAVGKLPVTVDGLDVTSC